MDGAPNSTFTVDNSPPLRLNSSGNLIPRANSSFWAYVMFFDANNLEDGDHTAVVTVDEASLEFPFYFDFFTVTGAKGQRNVIVDDADDTITYTGDWIDDGSYKDYLGTNHESPSAPGGSATIEFNGQFIPFHCAQAC